MIHVLKTNQLAPFLKRHMQIAVVDRDLRLDEFLRLVLDKANQFVPSQSGMILLDDPASKTTPFRSRNMLAAVACFGPRAKAELGKRYSADSNVAGTVYVTGQPVMSRNPSVLCVPIAIRQSVVGVLQLSQKKAAKRGFANYSPKDFELLTIFADYISASVQNFLDAKRNSDMARKDALTGLSNDRQLHAFLQKEVKAAWRAKRELGMIFVDLDHFKDVNDEFGHLVGSQLLAEVALVMRRNIDWPRAEIARYGGDEYVVVLPGADFMSTMSIAENLRLAIERNVFLSKSSTEEDPEDLEHLRSARRIFGASPVLNLADRITASLGVACLLAHVKMADASRLLRLADEAMYESKRLGRNRVSVTAASAPEKAVTSKKSAETTH